MSPFDQLPTPTHPETTTSEDDGAPTLHAVFIADERPAYLGLYTGARCVLPTGDVAELRHRRTPLYDLARALRAQGYGDCRLESFTPAGTPSLRGLVKVMAGLTVEEGPHGLTRRKYRPGKACESAVDSQVELEGTRGGGGPETPDRAPGPDRTTGEAA